MYQLARKRFPVVSIIAPCYNESSFIDLFMESLESQDYPLSSMEVLIVDGGSKDGTLEVLKSRNGKIPFRILNNKKKLTPFAINLGIQEAKGHVIARLDIHAVYPTNYISTLVKSLQDLNCENVGVSLKSIPPNPKSSIHIAISRAISSKAGVGSAQFRTGSPTSRIEVDTVPFGCYPREVFEKFGYFNDAMTRGQDCEHNHRIKKGGGKVYLVPSVQVEYYCRDSFQKLFKMYYQYGFSKPFIWLETKSIPSYRQLAPLTFFTFLISLFIISLTSFLPTFFPILIVTLYLAAIALSVFDRTNIKVSFLTTFAITSMHTGYFLGTLIGLVKIYILNQRTMGNLRITR